MSLTCTCTHFRKDHDGGKKALNDRRVGTCDIAGCNCKEYSADEKSRKRKQEILLASCTVPAIIVGVCIVGFALSWVAIDFMMKDYTVTSEFEYKKFQDGKEVPNVNAFGTEPPEPKERLTYLIKEMVGLIFVSVAMFGGMFSGMLYYDSKIDKLVKGETE